MARLTGTLAIMAAYIRIADDLGVHTPVSISPFLFFFQAEDGIRDDEVRVIRWYGGWFFAQGLTNTVRYLKSNCVQIAEFWDDDRPTAINSPPGGMGFDLEYEDRFREAVRSVLGQAAGGAAPPPNSDPLPRPPYTRRQHPATRR